MKDDERHDDKENDPDALRVADLAAYMGHEIVLRAALLDASREKEPIEHFVGMRLHDVVQKNDDVRCFEVLLDAELSERPEWWHENLCYAPTEEKTLYLAYHAARNGALKCLGVLERRGLDFCSADPASPNHPLYGAVDGGQAACAEFLLDRGVSLPVRPILAGPPQIANPLIRAAAARSGDPVETIEVLRRHPPHAPYGPSPTASRTHRPAFALQAALTRGTARAVRHVLGFSDHTEDELEHLLTSFYAEDDRFEAVEKLRVLIDLGADLGAPAPFRRTDWWTEEEDDEVIAATPLQICVSLRYYASALELLEVGVDPNVLTESTPPALHLLLIRADTDADDGAVVFLLRALLGRGADAGLKFRYFHGVMDALELAEYHEKEGLAAILRQHTAA